MRMKSSGSKNRRLGRMLSGVSKKTDAMNRLSMHTKSADMKMGINTKISKRLGLKPRPKSGYKKAC